MFPSSALKRCNHHLLNQFWPHCFETQHFILSQKFQERKVSYTSILLSSSVAQFENGQKLTLCPDTKMGTRSTVSCPICLRWFFKIILYLFFIGCRQIEDELILNSKKSVPALLSVDVKITIAFLSHICSCSVYVYVGSSIVTEIYELFFLLSLLLVWTYLAGIFSWSKRRLRRACFCSFLVSPHQLFNRAFSFSLLN